MSALMNRLVNAPASLRWHTGALLTRALYRRAFAAIGEGTVIASPRRLTGTDRISIGSRGAVYEGVWLGSEGAPLRIGDDVYIGHDVHIHALSPVTIGNRCMFADGVFINSGDHDRRDRSQVRPTGPITIGDGVFLGQRVIVLGGVTIGAGATVGAGAVVTRDVPAGAVVAGVPARPIG